MSFTRFMEKSAYVEAAGIPVVLFGIFVLKWDPLQVVLWISVWTWVTTILSRISATRTDRRLVEKEAEEEVDEHENGPLHEDE